MARLKMHGPSLCRHIITDFLKVELPAALVHLRVEWDMDVESLPNPVKYVPYEPGKLDQWPTIAVVTGVESTTRRIEHGSEGGEFVSTYPIEVYSWVNFENTGVTQDARDAMATALKVVLLENPTFDRPQQDIVLNEATFEQRYSDMQKVKGDRFVAGSLSAFDVLVTEHLGPYGSRQSDTVDTVAVRGYSEGTPFIEASTFPIHPAFE